MTARHPVLLLALLLLTGCGDNIPTYDLHQVRLDKGQILRTETQTLGRQGNVQIESSGKKEAGILDITQTNVIEQQVISTRDGLPTQFNFEVLHDHTETGLFWGDIMRSTEVDSTLLGFPLLVTFKDSAWQFQFKTGKPTEEQMTDLNELAIYENRGWLPTEPVKVGDQWSFDPAFMRYLLQRDIETIEAGGVMKLVKVEERDGATTAVLALRITSKGEEENDETGAAQARLDFDGILEIDLKTKLDKKLTLVGHLTSSVSANDVSKQVQIPLNINIAKRILSESEGAQIKYLREAPATGLIKLD